MYRTYKAGLTVGQSPAFQQPLLKAWVAAGKRTRQAGNRQPAGRFVDQGQAFVFIDKLRLDFGGDAGGFSQKVLLGRWIGRVG